MKMALPVLSPRKIASAGRTRLARLGEAAGAGVPPPSGVVLSDFVFCRGCVEETDSTEVRSLTAVFLEKVGRTVWSGGCYLTSARLAVISVRSFSGIWAAPAFFAAIFWPMSLPIQPR